MSEIMNEREVERERQEVSETMNEREGGRGGRSKRGRE